MSLQDAFLKFKSGLELNPSFDEKIKARHNAVRSIVQTDSTIATKLIGSIARKTRIQPRPDDTFDVDILVVLGSFNQWVPTGGVTADAAISRMLGIVQSSERYASKNPSPDKPTVNIAYQDNTKVELVPAYLDLIGSSPNGTRHAPVGRAYWVPKHTGWELADYDFDAEYVSSENHKADGWLIPTIKMLKAIKRTMFPYVPSFYFEMLATLVLSLVLKSMIDNRASVTYPILISRFFKFSGGWLELGLSLPGSLTQPVTLRDDVQKRSLTIFASIDKYCDSIMQISSETEQQRHWRVLCEEPFPAI
jgi:hypothetical protein